MFCIQVKKEILKCYELIHKLGKGVVYLGSSRTKPDHPDFVQAMELGREVKPFGLPIAHSRAPILYLKCSSVLVLFAASRIKLLQVAFLLDCTTWTGAGPGMMDAVVKGALQAGKPVGGFKISKEAGEWTSSNFHHYLENHVYYTCRQSFLHLT